jgi:2-keto-4-pentenoate hydratase/2-oxohepta-3-ene-1,7-dioic acid hydratase in catechol pathway
MTLNEGDMILTGTPAGASYVKVGDKVDCKISQNGEVLVDLVCYVGDK